MRSRPERLLAESQAALTRGDFATAERRCEEAVLEAPQLATAHQLAAAIAIRQGQEPRAQRHLRHFLELQPTHVEGWFSLGNSCRRAGAIREAEVAYRQALHVDLQHGASRRALVSLLTEQGHGDAAVAIAEAGLRYAPSDLKLRALLGEALLATEAFEPALAQFAEALKADPTFAAALQGKALALRGLDRPEEALALLEALETQGLTHFSIAHNMGNVLSDLGRLEAAAQAYETAIARNPGYGSSYSNLARTLWCLGDQKGFLAAFEQAFASGRHDPSLIKAYLDALLAVGDRETFNTARRAFPAAVLEGPALQDTLARASAQAGDFAAARRHHHNALAHPEAPVQWHCHAAQSDLLAGDPEAAATRLDAALRREPGNGFLLAYLGVAWTQLGDPRAEHLLATNLIHEQDLGVPPGFSTYEEFQRALKAELAQEHTANQHPFEQTLRGGTQTQGNILRLKTPAVRALRLQLERAVEHSLATLRAREAPPPHGQFTVPGPWRFSGAWSVMLKPGGFHTMHVHPMGFYSAVYYVEAPPKDPSAPHAGWLQFGPPDLALPAEVPIRKLIEPIAGRIALFPSYFWHGTRPFTLGTHRTTVAFDVVGRPAPES